MATLSALHSYPLKSARGLTHAEATLHPWGLDGDRRWMVIDSSDEFISQRSHPLLAQVEVTPGADGAIRLRAPGRDPLTVVVPEPGKTRPVALWRDTVEAVPTDPAAAQWLGSWLEDDVSLVHLDDPSIRRQVDQHFGEPGETVGFADGYPLLITTTSSLDALNGLIADGDRPEEGPLPMNRFRPNLVIDDTDPWAEDGWHRVRVGDVTLRIVKPCGRCAITTTDQETAERGREPLRTLARHRNIDRRLVFGQNAIPETTDLLRVGDSVTVLD